MVAESDIERVTSGLSNAESRWARFGPYYAMFPVDFAFNVVKRYTRPGDAVLDPFAGRFTSIFAASALGRYGVGIEINPVGWLYGRVKLAPAPLKKVLDRLYDVDCCKTAFRKDIEMLPDFFRLCFCDSVLMFLLSAKKHLNWRRSGPDATLMAHILIYLHGKRNMALSNQMRMTKAMSPDYSVRWWKAKGFNEPPEIDTYAFLKQRIEWRYKKGMPDLLKSKTLLGDCTKELSRMKMMPEVSSFNLLFTSPPYAGVVNYYTDQWLRMWMLGGTDRPVSSTEPHLKRFADLDMYRLLLEKTFTDAAQRMAPDGTVFVRTDARPYTFETTKDVLRSVFPNHSMEILPAPYLKKTQTSLFGDPGEKPGEMDIILSSKQSLY